MRVLSPDELKQILKVCSKPRDKAMILFLVDTGLTSSEACPLNWIDVDIPSGVVNARRTKNKKTRSVYIGIKQDVLYYVTGEQLSMKVLTLFFRLKQVQDISIQAFVKSSDE